MRQIVLFKPCYLRVSVPLDRNDPKTDVDTHITSIPHCNVLLKAWGNRHALGQETALFIAGAATISPAKSFQVSYKR